MTYFQFWGEPTLESQTGKRNPNVFWRRVSSLWKMGQDHLSYYYLIFTRDAFQGNTNGGGEDYELFLLFPKHTG